jgi:hypothetical protein
MSFGTAVPNVSSVHHSNGTVKQVKVHPRTCHESPRVKVRYSSTLSLTPPLDGMGNQRHFPGALPPRKTRYPLYRRLGGPQGRSGRVRKQSPPSEFDPRTVASFYTDRGLMTVIFRLKV